MKRIKPLIFLIGIIALWMNVSAQDSIQKKIIYTFDIKEEIAPPAWRKTKMALEEANALKADAVIIQMNTYGGAVNDADSIRTKILNSNIPIYVFIDNNAASAGALISIACDSIYMRSGGNIGAATVVNQTGEQMPDKYQSFMRSMMRSTAEASGRDPKIAEAMVDDRIYIPGIIDSGKVLTFTTKEAIEHNFCEGEANNITELIELLGFEKYEIKEQTLTTTDKIIDILIAPYISSILIMIIIGGIYFELQSPGIGFPIAASVVAALLYFAPLYLEGLAANWEILIFVVGVLLLIVEIFVIPGFGIAGVTGALFIMTGLTMSMVNNPEVLPDSSQAGEVGKAFSLVIFSIAIGSIVSLILAKHMIQSKRFMGGLALTAKQDKTEGFTSADTEYSSMKGKTGIVLANLHPSGKVIIDNEIFDAVSETGFIEKGKEVIVHDYQNSQLFVSKKYNIS